VSVLFQQVGDKMIAKLTSVLRFHSLQLAAMALAAIAPWSTTLASDFPKQAVEMTVLFGGSSATIAQVLADGMSKQLKVPVAAVSRTGGGGAAGYSFVKATPPNGYNIVWNSNSINTNFHGGNIPFDYRSFDPVAQVGMEVPALAVRRDSGWKTLADVAAAGKKQKLKVGISGRGSFTHLASAALFKKMGIEVIYVPYGTGSAPVELLGGRVDAALQWPSQFTAMADKIQIVAVTSDIRVPLVPQVPTAKEQGFDVSMVMWRGIAVPAGTPKDVIARLQSAVQATVASADFKAQSAKLGFEPEYLPAVDFGKVVAGDDVEYDKLMTELGLKK
jgi:tripartite-type tricarboxylate transporter receptor subunit TctC